MTYTRTAAFLLLTMAGPLWAAKAPAWTKGPDPKYPDSKYIHGVGVGTDIDAARANARAEISRVFQARVQQTVKDVQTESSTVVGKKRGPALGSQNSVTQTELSTESLLEGVVIKETWYHRKTKTYYALALLDKPATQRALSQRILALEETMTQRRAEAAAAASPMARAGALAKALAAARERDTLAARRALVDPAGMAALGSEETSQIEAALSAALGAAKFYVDTGGDTRLRQKISARLSQLGLATLGAAPAKGENAWTVRARLEVQPLDRGHPQWKYFQWQGSVELLDEQGRALQTATPSGSEGHLSEELARSKTQQAGEDALAQEAGQMVSDLFFK